MMEQNANTSASLSRAPIGNGKALVVGLGGCGIRILESLRANPRAKWLVTLAVDTDGGVLAGTRADAVINASADWTSKSCAGCGGDVIRGERAVSHERAASARSPASPAKKASPPSSCSPRRSRSKRTPAARTRRTASRRSFRSQTWC